MLTRAQLRTAIRPAMYNDLQLHAVSLAFTMEDEEPKFTVAVLEGGIEQVLDDVLEDAHNAWVAGWTVHVEHLGTL